MLVRPILTAFTLLLGVVSLNAHGESHSSRDEWTHWRGIWSGNFWEEGNFGQLDSWMSCVGVDGSYGSPEFWAYGTGNKVARDAYLQTLSWSNVAERNIAYITVECGY